MFYGGSSPNHVTFVFVGIPLASILTYMMAINTNLRVYKHMHCAIPSHKQQEVSDYMADITEGDNLPGTTETRSENCDFLQINNISAYKKYIIPVWNVSYAEPSAMHTLWRIAVKFAVFQHRTFVIRPFIDYNTLEPRNVDTTFDLEKLKEILPVASEKDFISLCGNTLTANNVFIPPSIDANSKETIYQLYQNMAEWKVLFQAFTARSALNNIPEVTSELDTVITSFGNSATNDYHNSKNEKCIALFPTDDLVLPCNDKINTRVEQYLVRAPYIRQIAERFISIVCGGNFAVIHLHLKSRERCHRDVDCIVGKKREVEDLCNAANNISETIEHTLRNNKLNCIYVAAPPSYKQKFADQLKLGTLQVFAFTHIFEMVPESTKYQDDDYIISLIEQEIAERIPLFISSRQSSWSFYVEYTRTIRKMKTVAIEELA